MKKPITTENNIHIGQLLKDYLTAHRIVKSALARRIGKNDNEILRYQKSTSLTTDILLALSSALKHNFFADIALLLPATYSQTISAEAIAKDQRIAALEQENLLITNERNLLLQVLSNTK
jgi:transcriptional regulator with XRE-family HTH domain